MPQSKGPLSTSFWFHVDISNRLSVMLDTKFWNLPLERTDGRTDDDLDRIRAREKIQINSRFFHGRLTKNGHFEGAPLGPSEIFGIFFGPKLKPKDPLIGSGSPTLNICPFWAQKCQNGHFWFNSQVEVDKKFIIFNSLCHSPKVP